MKTKLARLLPSLPAWRPLILALGLALGTTLLDTDGEEAPPVPPSAPAAVARSAPLPVNPEEILQKNTFDLGTERPPPPPPPPPPAPPSAAPTPPPAPPPADVKPPFKLLGTLAGKSDASLAFLEKDSKSEAVRIGGVWEQATVVDVARNRATIKWKNKLSTLEVDFKDWGGPSSPQQVANYSAPVAQQQPAAVYTPPSDVPMPESIETRKVPRGEVDRNLQDLAGLLGSMRIQPFYESGQPAGFLLSSIRPGAFIDQVGIQNGDILKFVNGQKIDNVQNAFQLYNIFKNSTNVEATVMRDGRPVTLKYMIE